MNYEDNWEVRNLARRVPQRWRDTVAVLNSDRRWAILAHIALNPGCRSTTIIKKFQLNSGAVHHHIDHLENAGLVRRERAGQDGKRRGPPGKAMKGVKYDHYLTPWGEAVLDLFTGQMMAEMAMFQEPK